MTGLAGQGKFLARGMSGCRDGGNGWSVRPEADRM